MKEIADMAKKRIIGLLASLFLVVALAIFVSFILAADSSDGVALGESAVSLEADSDSWRREPWKEWDEKRQQAESIDRWPQDGLKSGDSIGTSIAIVLH